MFGPEELAAAIYRYEALTAKRLSRRRIALYHVVAMLSHVAFALEDPGPRQLETKRGWIRALAADRDRRTEAP